MDERHLYHADEVLRGLLESRQHASALLQPTDQPLDDVAIPICVAVEFDRRRCSVFVFLAGNHGLDAKLDEVAVNPVGSVTFVARQLCRIDDREVVLVDDVHVFEQRLQRLVVMRLARGDVHMQGMPVPIAEQMNFRGKTAA